MMMMGARNMLDDPNVAGAAGAAGATGVGIVWWLARTLFGSVIGQLRASDMEIRAGQAEILKRLDSLNGRVAFIEGRMTRRDDRPPFGEHCETDAH